MTANVLAPEAVHDLHDLWDCIAADHVMDTLFAAFAQLGLAAAIVRKPTVRTRRASYEP